MRDECSECLKADRGIEDGVLSLERVDKRERKKDASGGWGEGEGNHAFMRI